jgi:hypothetical protein
MRRLPAPPAPSHEHSDIGSTEHRSNLGELALLPINSVACGGRFVSLLARCGKRRKSRPVPSATSWKIRWGRVRSLSPCSPRSISAYSEEVVLHQLAWSGKKHLHVAPAAA